jgi:hypothetical protein
MSNLYESSANLPLGSGIITIGVPYAVEGAVNIQTASRGIRRLDPNGDAVDLIVRGEPATLTATLQRATGSTVLPARGNTFTMNGITFVVMQVALNKPQGDYHTFDLTAESPSSNYTPTA